MDVQVWPGADPGQLLVIVSVNLPASEKLPAVVRIPMIDGMRLLWAGEISRQQGDVQRQPEIKQGAGGDYAEFQVATSRQAQIELGSVPLSQTADGYSAAVKFVQSVPVETTAFSVRLPNNVSKIEIEPRPADSQRNDLGELLFTLPSKQLAPGESHTVKVSYRIGPELVPVEQGPPVTIVVAVLGALIVLAVVVLVLVARRSTAARVVSEAADAEEGLTEREE